MKRIFMPGKAFRTAGAALIVAVLTPLAPTDAYPQIPEASLRKTLEEYFSNYRAPGFQPREKPRLAGYTLYSADNTLVVEGNEIFASQPLTPKIVSGIYESLRSHLPDSCKSMKLIILADGKELKERIPNPYRENADKGKTWGETDYRGEPWVTNVSKAYTPTQGLQNRHFSVWASHGRYYNNGKNEWQWQRPHLFCTNEDLLTQTIVVPFLIPMLQNAGAIVYSPRERDWQCNEIVIDNDSPATGGVYEERQAQTAWRQSPAGFANPKKEYVDGENPFNMGSARCATAASDPAAVCEAAWIPGIRERGNYAVYVSYQTHPDAVNDAHYTVRHCGIATEFLVNQKMGGGTWVYLGTFFFSEGEGRDNCVTLTNESNEKGVVSADAVRFGGGMGNIARGSDGEKRTMSASGLPRYLEGARYSAQWAGIPYNEYSVYGGENDYKDDINARPYATNYLAGGSVYLPSAAGAKVPIELCLALHSDAGLQEDGLIGTLGVCTTTGMNGEKSYPSGLTREASNDLAQMTVDNVAAELSRIYGIRWPRREVFDRVYSETCRPDIPSAIIEMFSHQNFNDMAYAHDPNFKFNIARSIYKAVLRYTAFEHGFKYAVSPLAPDNLSLEFASEERDEVLLRWDATADLLEPAARPDGYVVYTRIGDGDFDNGTYVKGRTSYSKKLIPGKIYSFKVTAVNTGGESFPSETLAAFKSGTSERTVLIVNCFNRLAGPAAADNAGSAGFDLDADLGVPYIQTPEYCGALSVSDTGGYGRREGTLIAGNTFDYVKAHGEGFSTEYSFVSCSRKAVETGSVRLSKYHAVDMIFGLEKHSASDLGDYKTFTPLLRSLIKAYLSEGGRILVSGAYIGSDMKSDEERKFLRDVLGCSCANADNSRSSAGVEGMGLAFSLHRSHNAEHYAAPSVDKIEKADGAETVFRYSDGMPAGISCRSSKGRAVVLGFPVECIKEKDKKNAVLLKIAHRLAQE